MARPHAITLLLLGLAALAAAQNECPISPGTTALNFSGVAGACGECGAHRRARACALDRPERCRHALALVNPAPPPPPLAQRPLLAPSAW